MAAMSREAVIGLGQISAIFIAALGLKHTVTFEKPPVCANFANCKIIDFRFVDTGMLGVKVTRPDPGNSNRT
jgi:hypothetical protein